MKNELYYLVQEATWEALLRSRVHADRYPTAADIQPVLEQHFSESEGRLEVLEDALPAGTVRLSSCDQFDTIQSQDLESAGMTIQEVNEPCLTEAHILKV